MIQSLLCQKNRIREKNKKIKNPFQLSEHVPTWNISRQLKSVIHSVRGFLINITVASKRHILSLLRPWKYTLSIHSFILLYIDLKTFSKSNINHITEKSLIAIPKKNILIIAAKIYIVLPLAIQIEILVVFSSKYL